MTNRNDGGPAFPVELGSEGEGMQTGPNSGMATGMSLRDYFAACALQGMLASEFVRDHASDGKPPDEGCAHEDMHKHLSRRSFQYADAMLKQREID